MRSPLHFFCRQVEGSCSWYGHVGEEENYRSNLELNTNLIMNIVRHDRPCHLSNFAVLNAVGLPS